MANGRPNYRLEVTVYPPFFFFFSFFKFTTGCITACSVCRRFPEFLIFYFFEGRFISEDKQNTQKQNKKHPNKTTTTKKKHRHTHTASIVKRYKRLARALKSPRYFCAFASAAFDQVRTVQTSLRVKVNLSPREGSRACFAASAVDWGKKETET